MPGPDLEPTAEQLLDDPMTLALMQADKVDPAALRAMLADKARRLPLGGAAPAPDLEPTAEQLLDDPMTLALMQADKVDPAALRAMLADKARRLPPAPPPELAKTVSRARCGDGDQHLIPNPLCRDFGGF